MVVGKCHIARHHCCYFCWYKVCRGSMLAHTICSRRVNPVACSFIPRGGESNTPVSLRCRCTITCMLLLSAARRVVSTLVRMTPRAMLLPPSATPLQPHCGCRRRRYCCYCCCRAITQKRPAHSSSSSSVRGTGLYVKLLMSTALLMLLSSSSRLGMLSTAGPVARRFMRSIGSYSSTLS